MGQQQDFPIHTRFCLSRKDLKCIPKWLPGGKEKLLEVPQLLSYEEALWFLQGEQSLPFILWFWAVSSQAVERLFSLWEQTQSIAISKKERFLN